MLEDQGIVSYLLRYACSKSNTYVAKLKKSILLFHTSCRYYTFTYTWVS